MRINYMTSMEGDTSRGAVIINRAAQEVLVIINDRRIYTRLVQQEGIRNPFLLDMSMQFTKTGSDVVAGQPVPHGRRFLLRARHQPVLRMTVHTPAGWCGR